MKMHVFSAAFAVVLLSANLTQAQDDSPAPLFGEFGDFVVSPQEATQPFEPELFEPEQNIQPAEPAPVIQPFEPAPVEVAEVAEEPTNETETPRLTVSGRSDSDIRESKPSVMELRQARAMYRSAQRIARMERNLWYGYEPLRPGWTTVHYMQSRYNYQRTAFVPVYYYGR